MLTVVELPSFTKLASELFLYDELMGLIDHVSKNPESGKMIPETGGFRKLRWGVKGKGKRGGARIIYIFYSKDIPVFLISCYSKSEKEDLTSLQRKQLRVLSELIIREYR